MDADEKRRLLELIERGDDYGLLAAAVRAFVRGRHPAAIRAAVYVVEEDDAEPTRIRIPLSASGS